MADIGNLTQVAYDSKYLQTNAGNLTLSIGMHVTVCELGYFTALCKQFYIGCHTKDNKSFDIISALIELSKYALDNTT